MLANKVMEMGLKPVEEFLTLYPTDTKNHRWEIQFSTPIVAGKFSSYVSADRMNSKALFKIHVPTKSILLSRCPGNVGQQQLENALFPPLAGKITVVSRHTEQHYGTDGKPICYTGRRFINILESDFKKNKHLLPTFINMSDSSRKIFVNFEGSEQQCYNCRKTGHIARGCPKKLAPPPPSAHSTPIKSAETARELLSESRQPLINTSDVSTVSTPVSVRSVPRRRRYKVRSNRTYKDAPMIKKLTNELQKARKEQGQAPIDLSEPHMGSTLRQMIEALKKPGHCLSEFMKQLKETDTDYFSLTDDTDAEELDYLDNQPTDNSDSECD